MHTPVDAVTVVPYREEFKAAFERLNREWIEQYFKLEEADREVFSDPKAKILNPGGQIFFVVAGNEVVGTCAVLRHGPKVCEIAKMAVAPGARGRGLGDLLMDAAVQYALEVGAQRIIIVSNTVLEPAIRLYRKHGFVPVPLSAEERYQRANIRMELELPPRGPGGRPGAGE
ncbi:MAG TPA: GNAT family N-acetyltransferase [Gemmatimonadales bacterium]